MSEFSGPADPRHGATDAHGYGSAAREVIAEVWTLLDGECTPETREKLRQHLEACPRMLQASTGSRSGSRR